MSKVLIVHWYCNNISSPFKKKDLKYWSLSCLKNLFENDDFSIFKRWINFKVWYLSFLNIFWYLLLYINEKKLTNSKELQKKLYDEIKNWNYEIIIAHSMWTVLTLNTLNNFWVTGNLKKIITIQSDMNYDFELKNTELIKSIKSKKLIWNNYYNYYDFQLFLSTIINTKLRWWLFWIKNNYVNNIYHKLKSIDRHNNSIKDIKFLKSII